MSTPNARPTPGVSAFIYALLDSGSVMTVGAIAEAAGLAHKSTIGTVAPAREFLKGFGRLEPAGTRDKPAYRLVVEDRPALLAAMGERVEVPSFMGFSGPRATALRMIVEAAGKAVTLHEIAEAIHGRSDVPSRALTSGAITVVRNTLARRGSDGAILIAGTKSAGSYVWGKAPVQPPTVEQDPDAANGSVVITLPSVGGPYRYAAGRLQAPRFDWEAA